MSARDTILLERWIRERDAEAFDELVSRYAGLVYSTCKRILGNEKDAEDVAQECFLALAQSGTRVATSLGGWLHIVATHQSLNLLKQNRRRRRREQLYVGQNSGPKEPSWNDVQAHIDEAIAELPEKLRSVVVAHFLERQTHQAIANSLGIPRQTVTYWIDKGVKAIRKSLKKRGLPITASSLAAILASNMTEAAPATLTSALGKIAMAGEAAPTSAAALGMVASGTTAQLVGGLIAMKTKAVIVTALVVALLAAIGTYVEYHRGRAIQPAGPDDQRVAGTAAYPVELLEPQRTDLSAALTLASSDEEVSSSEKAPDDGTATATEESESESPDLAEPEREDPLASISGSVVDEKGYPVPEAAVCVAKQSSLYSSGTAVAHGATTDSAGLFSIEDIAFSGTTIVSANASGYRNASTTFEVKGGEHVRDMCLVLSDGVTLDARVVTHDDVPVPSAMVHLNSAMTGSGRGGGGGMEQPVFTGSDGRFSMGFREPGSAALSVTSQTHGRAFFNDVPVGIEEEIELRMGKAASLSGTVTWEDGTPASGVFVELRGRFVMSEVPSMPDKWGHGPVTGTATRLSTKTDEDGRYDFSTMPPDLGYLARVQSEEREDLSAEHDLGMFKAGESRTWDHVLRSGMKVFGRVTGQHTGTPIGRLSITCMLDGEIVEQPSVSPNGHYGVLLYRPGTYFLFPEYNSTTRDLLMEYGKEVQWMPGEEMQVDFQIPDHFTLSVRVVDTNGNPIERAKVLWCRTRNGGSGWFGSGHTDAHGEYSCSAFAPNLESWLGIEKHGYVTTQTAHITGEPGVVYPVETVVLFATAGVEGRLVYPNGNPVADTKITVVMKPDNGVVRSWVGDGAYVFTKTDADGYFAVAEGLPATSGRLAIFHIPPYGGPGIPVECVAGHVVDLGEIVFEH